MALFLACIIHNIEIAMKKKSKIKMFKKFAKGNAVLLAGLGGVAAGVALAGLLGSEKAKQLVQSVQDNVSDFGNQLANGLRKASNAGSSNT
jgi:hypothetical protein